MVQLVRAQARRAGDPGSNPGPGDNFSLKINNTGPARRVFYTGITAVNE